MVLLMSPLHIACERGFLPGVRAYLYYNNYYVTTATTVTSKINTKGGKDGITPLHIACKVGNYEIVELLLNYVKTKCSNDNNELRVILETQSDRTGWTALHYAADGGHLSIVDLLVQHYFVPVNVYALFGTPLHCAIRNGHLKMVQYLIKHGATVITEQIPTPFDVACQIGNRKIVSYLLTKVGPTVVHGRSLHYAIQNHHWKLVRQLIKETDNPSIRSLLCTRWNKKSIFDYDWVNELLEATSFNEILQTPCLYRSWNLLALICYQFYGKDSDTIELFQLTDDKDHIKLPPVGSKYWSSEYLEAPTPPPTTTTTDTQQTDDANTDPLSMGVNINNNNNNSNNNNDITNHYDPPAPLGPRVIMSETDARVLRSVLEDMATRIDDSDEIPQLPSHEEQVGESNEPNATTNEYLILDNVPNFKSASHNDYCWMVHAAVSIPVCPVRIIQFLCIKCFPNQLRVQRNGLTPLLLGCQRIQQQVHQRQYPTTIKSSQENHLSHKKQVLRSKRNKNPDSTIAPISTGDYNNNIDEDQCTNDVILFLLQLFPSATQIPDDDGIYPLEYAIRTKKVRCIQKLMNHHTKHTVSITNTDDDDGSGDENTTRTDPYSDVLKFLDEIFNRISPDTNYLVKLCQDPSLSLTTIYHILRRNPIIFIQSKNLVGYEC